MMDVKPATFLLCCCYFDFCLALMTMTDEGPGLKGSGSSRSDVVIPAMTDGLAVVVCV